MQFLTQTPLLLPRIIEHLTHRNITTYGLENDADLVAQNVDISLKELVFTAVHKETAQSILQNHQCEEIKAKIRLLGSYNIYNALAAIGVGLRYNCCAAAIREGLAKTVVPGRFELVNPHGNKTMNLLLLLIMHTLLMVWKTY